MTPAEGFSPDSFRSVHRSRCVCRTPTDGETGPDQVRSGCGHRWFPIVAIDAKNPDGSWGVVTVNLSHGQGMLIVYNGSLRIQGNLIYKGVVPVEGGFHGHALPSRIAASLRAPSTPPPSAGSKSSARRRRHSPSPARPGAVARDAQSLPAPHPGGAGLLSAALAPCRRRPHLKRYCVIDVTPLQRRRLTSGLGWSTGPLFARRASHSGGACSLHLQPARIILGIGAGRRVLSQASPLLANRRAETGSRRPDTHISSSLLPVPRSVLPQADSRSLGEIVSAARRRPAESSYRCLSAFELPRRRV
jgi:hypothetical protein